MASMATRAILAALLAAVVVATARSASVDALGSCVPADASCCPNIDYNVYSVLKGSFCRGLEPVFQHVLNNSLKNASHECRKAYVDATCITAIPECCSASKSIVYGPCRSVCENLLDKCGDAGRSVVDCKSSIWKDAPCNDGSGGLCGN